MGQTMHVVLLVGLMSHNSIHLLIIANNFVALCQFAGYVVFMITSFLASVCSILKVCPFFLGS